MSFAILTLLALPTLSSAYTWKFDVTPQQCSPLKISVTGSGGLPPYRVLILPFGPSPLPNDIEARKIIDLPFTGASTSISFDLNYPTSSQFVAVVSDATGFGSGGTSGAVFVTRSPNNSCYNSTANVSPVFVFSIDPPNQIVQCQSTRIWWDPSTVQGTPNFLGIIPGGKSFAVPGDPITDRSSQGLGTGFSWTPPIRGGTTLILVGGDARGNGTGGSVLHTVGSGINNNSTCLTPTSPGSTTGSPAGGSYPTGLTGGSGGSDANIGAIVGGVLGGVVGLAVLALLFLFFRSRSNTRKRQDKRNVDLLNADDEDDSRDGTTGNRNDLPEYYQPQPFTVPDPTIASTYDDSGATFSEGRRLSAYTDAERSATPDPMGSLYGYGTGAQSASASTSGRKGMPRQMRPVNVIQHDDAGPTRTSDLPTGEELETVELPPAYTNIRK